ncbi:MAG TPA: cupredoxin domain-containing protein [Candidatus Nanoarchaeia archaeon]|nr:cupredoxin domain-containing protein [Candidatus Nanoarchaeia archaeon]
MKNTTALLLIGLLVVVGAVFMLRTPSSSEDFAAPLNGDFQKVTLSEKNSNYFPQKITVKAGLPVELTLDSSVTGCFRSFTVRDLGVAKYARTPAEKITFVPTKKGTFPFSCSMGMGTGTLEVI